MQEKPTKCHYDAKKGISILYFKDDDNKIGEYYMRGGICWPVVFEEPDNPRDYSGYAILAGQDVWTKKIVIFEERSFVTVDHILRPNKTIEFDGLAPWFNRCWSHYFGCLFYWHQDFELAKKFRLETIRSQMVQPKPQFVEVPWSDDEAARMQIWKYIKLKALDGQKDGDLFRQMQQVQKEDKKTMPAVHALACLISGFERFPYRGRG